jgi:long-chain fatty acid transport protein
VHKSNRIKTNQSRLLVASVLGLAGATCLSSVAFASGYGLREGAADWLGNAFAGDTAKAYDASTVWSNPAGMVNLDQDELDAGVSYIAPYAKFSGTNTNPATGGNVSGSTGKNVVESAATAGSFGVFRLSPEFSVGFSLTAPYGERVSYPGDFVGRYQSLVSSITDINLGLALAYKLNDQWSIGGGPNFDYFEARLTQAINIPGLSAGTGQDPIADVHGNELGVGYNLGVLYKFDDATRIGLDYRSRIQHNITGSETVAVPGSYYAASPAIANALNAASGGATTKVTLPDSLSLGIYHQVNDKLALMGDVQWTDWSLLNKLNVISPNTGTLTIEEHWHNTVYAGIGANYQLLDNVLLQTGFAYDESPVNDSNRTSRIPDSDHYVIGFGAKYQVMQNVSLQLAYAHIFTPGGTINNAAASPTGLAGVISGSYDASANSVTAGLAVKF